MKTIKERAIEYCKEQWDEPTAMTAYMDGAIEQKAIDEEELLKLESVWVKEAQINHNDVANYKQGYRDAIENACEWLKERVQCGVHPQRAYGFAEEFRKAMEK